MAYFFYVKRGGKIWPRLSADHPKSGLHKILGIVEPIHEVKSPEDTFCLALLTVIYPPPEGLEE